MDSWLNRQVGALLDLAERDLLLLVEGGLELLAPEELELALLLQGVLVGTCSYLVAVGVHKYKDDDKSISVMGMPI